MATVNPPQGKIALAEMDVPTRFFEYVIAFEGAYQSRDWGSLARFFTEDAIYDSNPGPVFGGERKGWGAIEAHFASIMERFDRRFAREGQLVEEPAEVAPGDVPDADDLEADDVCRMSWDATYTIDGAPPLRVPGTEWAAYRGGRIFLLRDRISEETNAEIESWLEAHGHLIDWKD